MYSNVPLSSQLALLTAPSSFPQEFQLFSNYFPKLSAVEMLYSAVSFLPVVPISSDLFMLVSNQLACGF
jgi:hypothetical protein